MWDLLESEGSLLPGSSSHDLGSTSGSSLSFSITFCLVKSLKVIGLFLTYDLLKRVHLVTGLFLIQLVCTLFLIYNQKPFSSGPKLATRDWVSVAKYSVVTTLSTLLWFYGLTLCGPLRTVLVSEHPPGALMVGVLALLCQGRKGATVPARTRGAFLFLLGTLSLLLIDHDDNSEHHQAYHVQHRDSHQEIYTVFTHMFSWTDISDHKGGVVILACILMGGAGVGWYGRRVAAGTKVGGAKRLFALSTVLSTVMLSPWALYHYFTTTTSMSWTSLFSIVYIACAVKLADFYIEMASTKRSDRERLARSGAMTSFTLAFLLGTVWTQSYSFGNESVVGDIVTPVMVEDHQVSAGVILALILFMLATLNLTSSNRGGTRGFFVGYSAAGLPLYNLTSDSIHEAGQSLMRTARQGLKQIVDDQNSRKIFYFLLLNLFFTFVEFIYGAWTNSLGLISDGFHMLFDCSALVMGLYASVMARWTPSKAFSFGYDRLEILSGFVNGLFLAVIAINVFVEGLNRLVDPPTVGTERLLTVSVAGLVVNLIGILAFTDSHGHSHGGGGSHGHSHNVNMAGVYLHVLADTLGSVGVIISSLLIEYWGLNIADPICSLCIAILIFLSVLPLLRQSVEGLLLITPPEVRDRVNECLRHLPANVKGLEKVTRASVWMHTSDKIMGNVAVLASEGEDGREITEQVQKLLRDSGIDMPVVQVETKQFSFHLQGLGSQISTLTSKNVLGM